MVAAIHNLAMVLAVFAAAMLVTAILGFGFGEPRSAQQFIIIAVITGFVAGGTYFASRRPADTVASSAKYLFVVLVWLVPPLFASIPLMSATGGSYIPALFEAVSGITTAGASVFDQVGSLSRTALLWRAELHWLGGLLTLILIVTVLAPAGVGGIPDRHVVISRRPVSGEGARHWVLIRDLLAGYVSLTSVVVLGLSLAGIPVFDAFCLGMSAVSTGGFMPVDGGLVGYANPVAEIVLAMAMLIGATSVMWHRMALGARWQALREHRESYWVVGVAIAVGLAFAAAFASDGMGWGTALRQGLVNGASLVSTTGIEVQNDGFWVLPVPLVLLVAVVGGGAFSTAGGLRFFRIGGMLVQSINETRHLIYPHRVQPRLLGASEFDVRVMKAILSLFAASIVVIAVAAIGVALAGVDLGGAVAAAVSAFSNIGGVYASDWAEAASWPSFGEMPAAVQLLLAGTMIIGRLEIIAILVAISLLVWRS